MLLSTFLRVLGAISTITVAELVVEKPNGDPVIVVRRGFPHLPVVECCRTCALRQIACGILLGELSYITPVEWRYRGLIWLFEVVRVLGKLCIDIGCLRLSKRSC